METDVENLADDGSKKKHRQRKKQLFKSILTQMEFYFSDSNLRKERFLNELLAECEYVDLSVFLKFNKIRKLTTELDDIVKALKKSDFLELSEDCKTVKRKTEIQVKENVEDCTVYVENIQSDTSHDWLKNVFSEFGNVLYVSVPKYRHNKLNKGFAFIEFETEEEAKRTIDYFDSIKCKINSHMAPEDLFSIKTFCEEEKMNEAEKFGKKEESGCNEKNIKEEINVEKEENISKVNGKKRKHAIGDETSKDTIDENAKKGEHDEKSGDLIETKESDKGAKKRKHDADTQHEEKMVKKTKIDVETSQDNKDVEETEKDNKNVKTDDSEEIQEESKKKKKKSKKKALIKEMGLQVLPKKEWKRMRNRYLDMQKKKIKQLKQHLNRRRFNNKYEDKVITENNEKVENEKETKDKLKFISGVIVKLTLPETFKDLKKTKDEIKSMSTNIEYVDIPPTVNNDEVFVRFSSNESANDFCTKSAGGEGVVLEGEEEKLYWEKIKSSRDVKFNRETKKQRGRDKLLKKAERELGKHIIFDD